MRVLLTYLAVELLAVTALAWAFGPWWAFAIVLGSVLLGPALVGSQVRRQLAAGPAVAGRPDDAVTDGLLVATGSTLVLIPGVVSTALGGLMLAPPTRNAMRPLARGMLVRGVTKRFGALDFPARPRRTDYIDGEVVDGDFIDGEVLDADPHPAGTPNLPALR